MDMTDTCYYRNPYQRDLTTTIRAIEKYAQRTAVVLGATICYPEGGGQPGDRGTLNGITIVDTIKDDDDRILHILSESPNLSVGDTVHVELDWKHRYDYMQQHTAQHLLSGTFHRLFDIGTVSVHLGHEDMSIELDTRDISDETIDALEEEVNRIIRLAVPVTARTVTQRESQDIPLRRSVKVDGDVRLVTIGQFDTIACGGVHVADTAELASVQYLRKETIRGNTKTFWLAGDRALRAIRRNRKVVDAAGTLLSMPPEGIPEGIEALQQQVSDTRHQAHAYRSQVVAMKMESLLTEAPLHEGIPVVMLDASSWTEDEFRSLPETFFSVSHIKLCAVRERADGKLGWMVALKGFDQENQCFSEIRVEALPLIDGKGGGKAPLWQGVGVNKEGKLPFLQSVRDIFTGGAHGQTI